MCNHVLRCARQKQLKTLTKTVDITAHMIGIRGKCRLLSLRPKYTEHKVMALILGLFVRQLKCLCHLTESSGCINSICLFQSSICLTAVSAAERSRRSALQVSNMVHTCDD